MKKICVLVNAETRWVLVSRAEAAQDAKLGLRYASTNFTVGTTVSPLQCEALYMLYSMNMAA